MGFLTPKQQMHLYYEYRGLFDLTEAQDNTLTRFIAHFPGISFSDGIQFTVSEISRDEERENRLETYELMRGTTQLNENAIHSVMEYLVRSPTNANFESLRRCGALFMKSFTLRVGNDTVIAFNFQEIILPENMADHLRRQREIAERLRHLRGGEVVGAPEGA